MVGADVRGKRVLIVDDVISAGTAVGEAIAIIKAAGGEPAGVVIGLDRQEKGASGSGELPGGTQPRSLSSTRPPAHPPACSLAHSLADCAPCVPRAPPAPRRALGRAAGVRDVRHPRLRRGHAQVSCRVHPGRGRGGPRPSRAAGRLSRLGRVDHLGPARGRAGLPRRVRRGGVVFRRGRNARAAVSGEGARASDGSIESCRRGTHAPDATRRFARSRAEGSVIDRGLARRASCALRQPRRDTVVTAR